MKTKVLDHLAFGFSAISADIAQATQCDNEPQLHRALAQMLHQVGTTLNVSGKSVTGGKVQKIAQGVLRSAGKHEKA